MQIISCASQGLEAYAVQELVQHFKLVTSADIPVVCQADACSCKAVCRAQKPTRKKNYAITKIKIAFKR